MKSLIAVSLVAAACSSSSPSKPKAPADGAGRAERVMIGNLEAYVLADGHLQPPNDGSVLGVGQPPSVTGDLLAAAGLPRDTIRLDIQCLLVKSGDKVILFDTGMGTFAEGDNGHLPKSLALAGVQPEAGLPAPVGHGERDRVVRRDQAGQKREGGEDSHHQQRKRQQDAFRPCDGPARGLSGNTHEPTLCTRGSITG